MKRTEIVRRTPMKPGSALTGQGLNRTRITRKPTARLAQSRRELAAARDVAWVREANRCGHCDGPGTEVHHRLPRGAGGASRDPDAHALSRVILLCQECHRRVESDRFWAIDEGLLLVHGTRKPADVPVTYRGRKVFLTDDGQVISAGR